jgi:hypothetical protein
MLLIQNKRIGRHGKDIRKFVKWLNNRYEIPEIQVYCYSTNILSQEVLDDWNVIEKEETSLFGLYLEYGVILLAVGQTDSTLTLLHLAHELWHSFQHKNGQRFGEASADHWAANEVLCYQTR